MYRKAPRSIDDKTKALETVTRKKDATPVEEWIISVDTTNRLIELFPRFIKEVTERGDALSLQNAASMEEDKAQENLYRYVSHFIRVFNLGIERGIYNASDRSCFQIDINSVSTPVVNSESTLLLWAGRLVKGDEKRMAKEGAVPMSNPTTKEVEIALREFQSKSDRQMIARKGFDIEQKDVIDLLPQIDELIRDIWDEVEFYYRKETDARRRKLARDYGVVYVTRNENNEEVVLEEELLAE